MLRNLYTRLGNPIRFFNQTSKRGNVVQNVETQTTNNSSIIDNTVNGLNTKDIESVTQVTPSIKAVPEEVWHRMHNTFMLHGVSTENFLQIIAGNPKILKRPTNKVAASLEYWRNCQFGEYFLFSLLTKHPALLDITFTHDHHKLLKRINFLQSYVSTSKNVWRLFMISPIAMLEQTEESLAEKFKYFKEVMRLDIPEIVKSQGLSLALDEIKCRHVFMVRLGLFKPRSIRADPDEPSKNPRLYKITDTSDKTFATKVCHVSLDEYECFKILFQRELKRQFLKENIENDSQYDNDEDEFFSSEDK